MGVFIVEMGARIAEYGRDLIHMNEFMNILIIYILYSAQEVEIEM